MSIQLKSKLNLDGVISYFDAANSVSYVSGNTKWVDLTKNSNEGNLLNGVSFSGSNFGSLVFDGTNDAVQIMNTTPLQFTNTQPFSISLWINGSYTGTTIQYPFGYAPGGGYYIGIDPGGAVSINGIFFDYLQNVSTYRGIKTNTNVIFPNSWYNVVCTNNSSNSVTGMNIYLNGVLMSKTTRANSSPSTPSYSSGQPYIGVRNLSFGFTFKGNISNVVIYNKELSSNEVLENYNVIKNRYL